METNPAPNPNWLQDEILIGLQKLLALSLDRTPASELLPVTVGTWVEAISRGRDFRESKDRPRFRAAFVTLAENRVTWPAPRDLIEALPKDAAYRLAIGSGSSTAHVAKCFDEINELLHDVPSSPKTEAPTHKPIPLSEDARSLASQLDRFESTARPMTSDDWL